MTRFLLLFILFTSLLYGRLNPFEPILIKEDTTTDPVLTPQSKPLTKVIRSEDDGTRTVKIIGSKPYEEKKPKVIIKKTVVKEKISQKELEEKCEVINEKKIVAKKKVAPKLVEKTYKILPFLTIDLKKNKVDIKSRKKYKIIRYYMEPKEKKIVLDFEGKVRHYTKRDDFISQEFDSFVVGNHPKERFFRVVIKTKHNPNKYKVYIKNHKATLSYK